MMVTVIQYSLKKALGSKAKKLASMTSKQWQEPDESAIQLYLEPHVLREVLDKTTMADL